jgi:hypothetical protein
MRIHELKKHSNLSVTEASNPGHMDGMWILPDGKFIPVDHQNKIHHVHILVKNFGTPKEKADYQYEEEIPYAIDNKLSSMAFNVGWVRVTSFSAGVETVGIECTKLSDKAAKRLLMLFLESGPTATYQFNDLPTMNLSQIQQWLRMKITTTESLDEEDDMNFYAGFGSGHQGRFAGPKDPGTGDDLHQTDIRAIKKSTKSPIKQASKSAKKLSGVLVPILKKKKVDETIRRPLVGSLSAVYEVFKNDEVVGICVIEKNIITELKYDDEKETTGGKILSAILTNVVREADRNLANLMIQLAPGQIHDMKFFLERFCFHQRKEC